MAKTNGEFMVLKKIAIIIVIVTAIVSPYIWHDRAISKLQSDITYIKVQVDEINKTLHNPTVARAK